MITGFYASILAVMQIIYTMKVVGVRRADKVSLGDAGNDDLLRKIRAHGNFTETVPIALLLILVAELSGGWPALLHMLGAMLVIGRAMHYKGVVSGTGHGKFRFYGMVLTVNVIGAGALLCAALFLLRFIPV